MRPRPNQAINAITGKDYQKEKHKLINGGIKCTGGKNIVFHEHSLARKLRARRIKPLAVSFKPTFHYQLVLPLNMKLPLSCTSDVCEQRSVIHFLTAEKNLSKNINDRRKKYGEAAMTTRTVRRKFYLYDHENKLIKMVTGDNTAL
ncbi:hypothetical protein CBL_01721 [Carabus blaptoides fortunei]